MRTRIIRPRGPLPAWLDPLAEGFMRHLTRQGRRPKTLQAYLYELADFGQFLTGAGVDSLSAVRRSHIEIWQDEMVERKAPKTRQVAATALKGFLRWAADQDDLQLSSPTLWLRVTSPRCPPGTPQPVPRKDLQLLRQALAEPDWSSIRRLRARALFWTLLSSGSRIGAILALDRDSIRDGSVVAVVKGGGTHLLLFDEQACNAIADYLTARVDDSPALFAYHPHRFGGRIDGGRLAHQGADAAWRRLCKELGIPSFTNHQLRHSCASGMFRQRVDSLLIAKHLGHRSLQHIQNYAAVAEDQRREAMAALAMGA